MSIFSTPVDDNVVSINSCQQDRDTLIAYYREHNKNVRFDQFNASFLEDGDGTPIVFFHGNMTSSFCWRKLFPRLSKNYRCIALDMLGVRGSSVADRVVLNELDFQNQRAFIDGFFENVVFQREKSSLGRLEQQAILVIQGVGSILACDWAYRNPKRVKGFVHIGGAFPNVLDATELAKACAGYFLKMAELLAPNRAMLEHMFNATSSSDQLAPYVLEGFVAPYLDARAIRLTKHWLRVLGDRMYEPEIFAQALCNTAWLSNAEIPKLMLDTKETLIGYEIYRQTSRSFKCQHVAEFDGQYAVQEDEPDWVVDRIEQWLDHQSQLDAVSNQGSLKA